MSIRIPFDRTDGFALSDQAKQDSWRSPRSLAMPTGTRVDCGSGISGRDDCGGFNHEDDGTLRGACAVNNSLRYDEPLLRA